MRGVIRLAMGTVLVLMVIVIITSQHAVNSAGRAYDTAKLNAASVASEQAALGDSVDPPEEEASTAAVVGHRDRIGDVLELSLRVRRALAPFFVHPFQVPAGGFCYSDSPKSFLAGCPLVSGCASFAKRADAEAECNKMPDCGGLTQQPNGEFELRSSPVPRPSPHETSHPRRPCQKQERLPPTAANVASVFYKAVHDNLDDPDLHLTGPTSLAASPPPRDDDSIFIAISSSRDATCPSTVRRAFARADAPSKVSIGIVQHRCEHDCFNGTGWANTRRIVKQPYPDVDCVAAVCRTPDVAAHCAAGRVTTLRLQEVDSFGPFWTRFLGSHLWRGETYFLQIDAHTDFREGWDTTLVEMMKATPSFPRTVISNYPPGGTPTAKTTWERAKKVRAAAPGDGDDPGESSSALCKCKFETCPGNNARSTIRLEMTGRKLSPVPTESTFIAAGFFVAHSSFLLHVPFDPFMPFLFMGEEIALSIRFWTNGFDIYAPPVPIVAHEYVRTHSIKFWESVTLTYGDSWLYNALNNLTIQRVQHLVGFPEAERASQVDPSQVLTRMADYSVGTVRSRDAFMTHMGIDLQRKVQHPPKWCTGDE